MEVCYDLSMSPPTYDFVGFLLWATSFNQPLDILIRPGPVGGFRRDDLPPFNIEERQSMLDNIVVPMAWHHPSVQSVKVTSEIDPQTPGFGERRYGSRIMFDALKRGVMPLRAQPETSDGPYITITYRASNYWPSRNSNLDEWSKVIGWIHEFCDYEIITFADGFLDLKTRASLYHGARLNLFVNNGPAWFCAALGAKTFVCKMCAANAPCVDPTFFANVGFPVGSQLPNVTILWEDDQADRIIQTIEPLI